ncbi:hypothetical protein GLYMA_11G169901v4 [Glycine max]|nr:hypothetical protein GLYMA_11G169901v4 [Glycine max]KAH1159800.1 hypothetical protein GYH30_031507 [Glycine max]
MGSSWIRGKCVGKGAFGTVSVALRKRDDQTQIFAVKSVDLKTGLPGQLEALENEIRILQRMSSPHVVTFLGDDATCEQRNLHMEYMPGGTLADLDADVDEILVRHYTWCLVSALKHLHANGVVHCDVKGKNVLVGDGGEHRGHAEPDRVLRRGAGVSEAVVGARKGFSREVFEKGSVAAVELRSAAAASVFVAVW